MEDFSSVILSASNFFQKTFLTMFEDPDPLALLLARSAPLVAEPLARSDPLALTFGGLFSLAPARAEGLGSERLSGAT